MKFLSVPIFIIFLDQLTKILVKKYFYENNLLYQKINVLGEYIRIVFLENPGIAFGIDTSKYHVYITILTILAVIFLAKYLYHLIKSDSFEKLSMAFILGGAIGNLVDRLFVLFPRFNYNGVIDFIDIGFGQYRWYTFNLADFSITIGIIIFLYQFYILKKS